MKKRAKATSSKDIQPISKGDLIKLLQGYQEQNSRNIGALSEDFQHRVSAIGEQFGGLNKKLDEHGRTLDEHTRILNTHTQMIGRLMIDVQDIKNEKIGRHDFAQLEKRVVRIENILHGVRGK